MCGSLDETHDAIVRSSLSTVGAEVAERCVALVAVAWLAGLEAWVLGMAEGLDDVTVRAALRGEVLVACPSVVVSCEGSVAVSVDEGPCVGGADPLGGLSASCCVVNLLDVVVWTVMTVCDLGVCAAVAVLGCVEVGLDPGLLCASLAFVTCAGSSRD